MRLYDLYSGMGHKVFTASGRCILCPWVLVMCAVILTLLNSVKYLRRLVSGPLADMWFSFYCLKWGSIDNSWCRVLLQAFCTKRSWSGTFWAQILILQLSMLSSEPSDAVICGRPGPDPAQLSVAVCKRMRGSVVWNAACCYVGIIIQLMSFDQIHEHLYEPINAAGQTICERDSPRIHCHQHYHQTFTSV